MRATKITPAIRARCEQIALLKLQIPSYKDLELEVGVHHTYLAKIVFLIMEEIRNKNSSSFHVEPPAE